MASPNFSSKPLPFAIMIVLRFYAFIWWRVEGISASGVEIPQKSIHHRCISPICHVANTCIGSKAMHTSSSVIAYVGSMFGLFLTMLSWNKGISTKNGMTGARGGTRKTLRYGKN
jgi:hypothetical protein